MAAVGELNCCVVELAEAIRAFSALSTTMATVSHLPPEATELFRQAQETILNGASKMQRLLDTPVAFLQRLAVQVRSSLLGADHIID